MRAQYKPYKNLDRGQVIVSIPELIEACSHKVGYRVEKPTKSQMFNILEWLRNVDEAPDEGYDSKPMIETTKTTKGLVVTICNYNVYQDPSNYEQNAENDNENDTNDTMPKRQADTINKKVNKELRTKELKTVVVEEAPQNDLSAVFLFYEQNGFGTIGSYISEKIIAWCDDLSEELVLESLKQSVENGKKFWSYTEAILKNWFDKKITTVEQAHAAQLEHKEKTSQSKNYPRRRTGRQEQLPEWFEQKENQKPVADSAVDEVDEARRKRLEAIQQKYKQGG
ncbi:DnaD domain-containing protein [Bacillus sp. FSL K6-3431]|uniref:DnaD domain-containing protein n=1 Tax=Bacillus sp. FSL K6-3431 TaxID=2921500 RepID=UPI0030F716DD